MKNRPENLPDDRTYLNELEQVLSKYEKRLDRQNLNPMEQTVYNYLQLINKISQKEIPLKGKQRDYVSIQRILSDNPGLYLSKQVGDLSNYFSFFFRLS